MPAPSDDARAEAAVWQAMVLYASLATASEVWQTVQERRAGHDPTEQEAEHFVRLYLRAALGDVQALALTLRASLVAAEGSEEMRLASLVRRFGDLGTLHHAARLLHVVHQRLLSLYPAVDAQLVEDARILQARASALLDASGGGFTGAAEAFADDALRFCQALYAALRENPG